ncbi:MAG: exodeoxyribonuclease VII large subunit [Propionibacteriaceae bacterium]|nr:exodeoxyribonuclease VII large subunit [Propionibacteriaceae bacterium]
MAIESTAESPQPLRVVVDATKGWVERLGSIWVAAQLIELNRRAGHRQYLTLRDPNEEVSVSVSTTATVLDAAGPIVEGSTVAALLKPTVWRSNSRLVYECLDIRLTGEGKLLATLEQRKRKLQAEGLFDPELKKRLPFLPKKIGLITGAKSAAERDVLQNVRLRWPGAVFAVRNTLVQGTEAVAQIVAALAELDADPDVEVIVIARGGGSLEDLLPFSDETLIRAAFAAQTPIVSAIGHEIDNPILDLVADLRASTPTDAAKRIVPDVAELARQHQEARQRVRGALLRLVERQRRWLADVRSRPVMRNPAAVIKVHAERLAELRNRARLEITHRQRLEAEWLSNRLSRLRTLSPQATLHRGYAVLVKGKASVTSVKQVAVGDELTAVVKDGGIALSVRSDDGEG